MAKIERKTRVVTIRVPEDVYEMLESAADEIGTTRSQLVCRVLRAQVPFLRRSKQIIKEIADQGEKGLDLLEEMREGALEVLEGRKKVSKRVKVK